MSLARKLSPVRPDQHRLAEAAAPTDNVQPNPERGDKKAAVSADNQDAALTGQAAAERTATPASTSAPAPATEPSISAAATPGSMMAPGILSDATFASLELSPNIARAVEAMGHTHLTYVQQAAIPPLLQGKDVLGAARTGATALNILG